MEQIPSVVALRHELHQNPELSDQEHETAARIRRFMNHYKPHKTHKGIGGTGIAFEYVGANPGPTSLFRCELDALPIQETNNMEYASTVANVSHKCGHDGHMAIISHLAVLLSQHPVKNGRVVLLFQPAEETGAGSQAVVHDPKYAALKPDYAFALHNFPSMPHGVVYSKAGPFNCASCGIIIHLYGKTSHAAHPEDGVNPAPAMCEIMTNLANLPKDIATQHQCIAFLTLIHARLGEKAFGTSPGYGCVMSTLRTGTNDAMVDLRRLVETYCSTVAAKYGLTTKFEYEDVFSATANTQKGHDMVVEACRRQNVPCEILEEGYKWSEDFGHVLASATDGAMFVLGAGTDIPKLHNDDYNFPDSLIPIGASIFFDLVRQINGVNE